MISHSAVYSPQIVIHQAPCENVSFFEALLKTSLGSHVFHDPQRLDFVALELEHPLCSARQVTMATRFVLVLLMVFTLQHQNRSSLHGVSAKKNSLRNISILSQYLFSTPLKFNMLHLKILPFFKRGKTLWETIIFRFHSLNFGAVSS